MKNKPLVTGIIAVVSPVPLIVFTVLWSWIWCFGIGMGLLNYDTIPQWILICSLLPLFISPALGLLGIVHGIIKIKLKRAWAGILLSVLGLIENFILIYGMGYIGSRFQSHCFWSFLPPLIHLWSSFRNKKALLSTDKSAFLNDVCLRQMMLASPSDDGYA